MSVRSFHSVYMAGAVAAAALSCYLVSLRVASERAELDGVETRIVQTQGDIRMLQTEIGTRGRLDQLEQWNASALSLSAPAATQFLEDSFQLAKLAVPDHHLDVKAPVVMASAPAPQPQPVLGAPSDDSELGQPSAMPSQLIHEASLKIEPRETSSELAPASAPAAAKAAAAPKAVAAKASLKAKPQTAPAAKPSSQKTKAQAAAAAKPVARKAAPKLRIAAAQTAKPIRLAEADPLAPLPIARLRSNHAQQSRDDGRRK